MEVLVGKSSINGPFSIAMLNNQRVIWKPLVANKHKKFGGFVGLFPMFPYVSMMKLR